MSRKTIQVSEDLHKQLKLKSVQVGAPIPEVIASMFKEDNSSTMESAASTPKDDGGDISKRVVIPHEFWRQLAEDATNEELILMGYRIEIDKDAKGVTFTREGEEWTIPAEVGPEITPEEAEEATKLIEEYKRKGIDPRLEHTQERLIRWRMLVRAKARAIDLIRELEEGLGKRPTPAQYDSVYNDIQKLEVAMRNEDYVALKAMILEADPGWKEWTPPAGILISKDWLDRIYVNPS